MMCWVSTRMDLKTFLQHRKLSSKKAEEVQTDPLVVFHTAMENAQPVVGVQPIKKGGKTYQVCNFELSRWQ